eukprot:jgi/Mesvir1/28123/Mv26204-RA.1
MWCPINHHRSLRANLTSEVCCFDFYFKPYIDSTHSAAPLPPVVAIFARASSSSSFLVLSVGPFLPKFGPGTCTLTVHWTVQTKSKICPRKIFSRSI